MLNAKCPACSTPITYLVIQDMPIRNIHWDEYNGIVYTCPNLMCPYIYNIHLAS